MSTLLAELCQVNEERAEPSPWLRRALLALEARAYAAVLLLGIVAAQGRAVPKRQTP